MYFYILQGFLVFYFSLSLHNNNNNIIIIIIIFVVIVVILLGLQTRFCTADYAEVHILLKDISTV
jgi:uncharacterized membrane protein